VPILCSSFIKYAWDSRPGSGHYTAFQLEAVFDPKRSVWLWQEVREHTQTQIKDPDKLSAVCSSLGPLILDVHPLQPVKPEQLEFLGSDEARELAMRILMGIGPKTEPEKDWWDRPDLDSRTQRLKLANHPRFKVNA